MEKNILMEIENIKKLMLITENAPGPWDDVIKFLKSLKTLNGTEIDNLLDDINKFSNLSKKDLEDIKTYLKQSADSAETSAQQLANDANLTASKTMTSIQKIVNKIKPETLQSIMRRRIYNMFDNTEASVQLYDTILETVLTALKNSNQKFSVEGIITQMELGIQRWCGEDICKIDEFIPWIKKRIKQESITEGSILRNFLEENRGMLDGELPRISTGGTIPITSRQKLTSLLPKIIISPDVVADFIQTIMTTLSKKFSDDIDKNISLIIDNITFNLEIQDNINLINRIKDLWNKQVDSSWLTSVSDAKIEGFNKLKELLTNSAKEAGLEKEFEEFWKQITNFKTSASDTSLDDLIKNLNDTSFTNKIKSVYANTVEGKSIWEKFFSSLKVLLNELVGYLKPKGYLTDITQNFLQKRFKRISESLITKIVTKTITYILDFIGKSFRNIMNIGTFGTLLSPTKAMELISKYSKTKPRMAASLFILYTQLLLIKTLCHPVIEFVTSIFEWFRESVYILFGKDDKSELKQEESNVKEQTIKAFKEVYDSEFRKTYFSTLKSYIPVGLNIGPTKTFLELVWNGLSGLVNIIDGAFNQTENFKIGRDVKAEHEKIEKQKLDEFNDELQKLLGSNPNPDLSKENQATKTYLLNQENDFYSVYVNIKTKNEKFKVINKLNNNDLSRLEKYLYYGAKQFDSFKDIFGKPFDQMTSEEFFDANKEINKNINNNKDFKEIEKIKKYYTAGLKYGGHVYKLNFNKETYETFYIDEDDTKKPIKDFLNLLPKESNQTQPTVTEPKVEQPKVEPKKEEQPKVKQKPKEEEPFSPGSTEDMNESILNNIIKKIIMEQDEEKTLKMKDWNEIFTFQKVDDKNPGKFKDVEIKMDVVMDRMPHWRKKYKKECEDLDNCDDDGEDDSFVRAVIDTHPDVVRILFTKGLAHITSSNDQEDLNEGLHGLLSLIREAKNVEVEVWSVYRHPSSPDKIWSLVKGDYKQKELASMDVKMQQSPQNSTQKKTNSLDELKKKESNSIKLLSTDEKKGIDGLPLPLKKKVRERIKKGWTTELPSSKLMKFHKEDEMKSVFDDVIKLYKLKPNEEFFNFLKGSDLGDSIKRGFCRSIYYVEREFDLTKDKMSKVDDILSKCKNKFDGKYGQNYL